MSINVFTDFDIETASDVLTLLFKMDEQIDMEIDVEKDSVGNLIASPLIERAGRHENHKSGRRINRHKHTHSAIL